MIFAMMEGNPEIELRPMSIGRAEIRITHGGADGDGWRAVADLSIDDLKRLSERAQALVVQMESEEYRSHYHSMDEAIPF